jgi:galactokinase
MKRVRTIAPGRINIIGEHTDYNNGFVLPAAIDKNMTIEFETGPGIPLITIDALNFGERLRIILGEEMPFYHNWTDFIQGFILEIEKLKPGKIKNFNATISGNIPSGSGLSSSAALELAFIHGLNLLFDLGFSAMEMILLSQKVEHEYVGTKCGLMDQMASALGKQNFAIFLDCQSLDYEYVSLEKIDAQFFLINSEVKHELANSEYNTRRKECEEGVVLIQQDYPEIHSLRDCNADLIAHYREKMPAHIFSRCTHVVSENSRVLDAVNSIEQGNAEQLGKLMAQSHQSLSELYAVSCPELDFLVEKVMKGSKVYGARMMGGGFGGCTLNLVDKDFDFTQLDPIFQAYEAKFQIKPSLIRFSTASGVSADAY